MSNTLITFSPEALNLDDPSVVQQIAAQVTDHYGRALSAEQRIIQARKDQLLFGAMMAQLRAAISRSADGKPKRGRGSEGLKSWMEKHTPSVSYKYACDMASIVEAMSKSYALDHHAFAQLLSDSELARGMAPKRQELLGEIENRTLKQLAQAYRANNHGGARTPAPKPELTPADVRKLRMEELGTHIRTLQEMLFSQEDTLMWLEPTDLTQLADNLQGLTDQCRRSAGSMQAADTKASTRRVR